MLISAENIAIRYQERWIIRQVSLSVEAGEIVTLIGPNGSGKTSVLRALLGLVELADGQVRRAAGLTIGYVPQKLAMNQTMPLSVRRFLQLAGRYPPDRLQQVMEETGIAAVGEAQMQSLSGGEWQRTLLARALLGRPQLLILDEPLQGVDYRGEASLYELIGSLPDKYGCGILLVSHDLHIVMSRSARVFCLNGHICCAGSPQSVMESPEYLSLFGPRAAEHLALYRHHHDHHHLPDGRIVPRAAAESDPATIEAGHAG